MTILFYFIKFKINLLINNLKLNQLANDETCQILLIPNAQNGGEKRNKKKGSMPKYKNYQLCGQVRGMREKSSI
jgi:hypothetical protein